MHYSIPDHTFHGSKGTPLSGVLGRSFRWERSVVPLGSSFRRLAWFEAVFTAALSVALVEVPRTAFTVRHPRMFIFGWEWVRELVSFSWKLAIPVIVLASLLAAGCLLTLGFREAGARVQLTLGVLVALGLAASLFPCAAVLLLFANLAVWVGLGILIAVLCVGLVVLLIFVLLEAL